MRTVIAIASVFLMSVLLVGCNHKACKRMCDCWNEGDFEECVDDCEKELEDVSDDCQKEVRNYARCLDRKDCNDDKCESEYEDMADKCEEAL